MRIKKIQERWFQAKGDPDEAEVLIRHLQPGENQDIAELALPQKIAYVEDETGKMKADFSISPNRAKERELTFSGCVVGWKNFYDADENPLEFNGENLKRACREIEGFVEWINECRETLAAEIVKEKEAQEKNSSSSAPE
jgi:hypothetical protein